MKKYTILLTVLISFLTSVIIFSQTLPQKINYQGVLKDASGVVVANGDYNLTFKLYNTNSGGTALWTETKSLNVTDGIINTQLGSVTPVNLPFDVKYWLGVTIGAGTELTPRLELSSVPYSYMSMNVPNGTLTAEKIASGQVVKSINSMKDNVNIVAGSNVTITPSGNNLTISTTGSGSLTLPFEGEVTTPDTKGITVIHSATTGTNTGLYGQINSTVGSAVTGIVNSTTGATRGIFGENHSSSGYGVYGAATNTSGINYGVFGRSYSSAGTGVYGFASNSGSTETYGVFGESNSSLGQGVRGLSPYIGVYGRGEATIGLNYGLYGRSQSIEGYGVYGTSAYIGLYGRSSGTSGDGYGVYGISNSTTGQGVYGIASSTSGTNYGVRGETNSHDGFGVIGQGPNVGVYGLSTATSGSTRYAVYGYSVNPTSGTAWAGYFNGNLSCTGYFAKGSGSFKIDHPLDPQNKYLYHSFVESPDMMNIYNGNVVTDGSGYATINLPDWFGALNKDFRYQLTVIGNFAQAIISKEVQNNQFELRTDKPNIKVSWQITGIRQDAYAEKNRIPIEEFKKADEIGKYLHPEAFGLSEEFSIDAQRNKKLQEELSKTKILEGELNNSEIQKSID